MFFFLRFINLPPFLSIQVLLHEDIFHMVLRCLAILFLIYIYSKLGTSPLTPLVFAVFPAQ